jgi:hypothetical protein
LAGDDYWPDHVGLGVGCSAAGDLRNPGTAPSAANCDLDQMLELRVASGRPGQGCRCNRICQHPTRRF